MHLFHKYQTNSVIKKKVNYYTTYCGQKINGSDHIVNEYDVEYKCIKCGKLIYKHFSDEYESFKDTIAEFEMFLSRNNKND